MALWPVLGCLAFGACGSPPRPAAPPPHVRIAGVDPAGPATLNSGDAVSLDIGYQSPRPVKFHVELDYRGAAIVPAASSEERMFSSSDHASFAWVSVADPVRADEARVTMVDAATNQTLAEASVPVQLQFTGRSGTSRTPPVWVARKRMSADFSADQADEEAQINHFMPNWIQTLVVVAFVLLVLGLLVAGGGGPIYAVAKWRGGWRLLAAIPLTVMGFKVLTVLAEIHSDPTSHNMLPFELGMWFGASAVFMALLWAARRIALRRA